MQEVVQETPHMWDFPPVKETRGNQKYLMGNLSRVLCTPDPLIISACLINIERALIWVEVTGMCVYMYVCVCVCLMCNRCKGLSEGATACMRGHDTAFCCAVLFHCLLKGLWTTLVTKLWNFSSHSERWIIRKLGVNQDFFLGFQGWQRCCSMKPTQRRNRKKNP